MNKENYKDCEKIKFCPVCKKDMQRVLDDLYKVQFKIKCPNGCYDVRYWHTDDDDLNFDEYVKCKPNVNGYTLSFLNCEYDERTYAQLSKDGQTFNIYISRISFIDGNPDLEKITNKLYKLMFIS